MPGHLKVRVKAAFGEIVVEGSSAGEILSILKDVPPDFLERIDGLVCSRLTPSVQIQLEGLVEFTTEGPVITARRKLTHYEAIGLVLFASEEKTNVAAKIERLLLSSGIKSMVPARLNEMTKRGLVYKPDPKRPELKLTTQGEKWVQDVIEELKGSQD